MTAKGTAIELVGKYCGNDFTYKNINKAKKHALICVDGIIKENKWFMYYHERAAKERVSYWEAVKNEINKL